MIRFELSGECMPQGSKVARIVGRRIVVGGLTAVVAPRAVMVESADIGRQKRKSGALQRWRENVGAAARSEFGTGKPWECPVELSCEFVVKRPPSHWTKSGRLKASSPPFPTRPDLSKLIRAVEDALTGIVYRDDGLVVSYGAMAKRYAEAGGVGGVRVNVRRL